MNIKLFISKAGRVLFTCDRFFKKPVEAVLFNFPTRELSLKFEGEQKPFTMNCLVDDYIAVFMAHRKTCGIGFEQDGELKQAVYVPLKVTNG